MQLGRAAPVSAAAPRTTFTAPRHTHMYVFPVQGVPSFARGGGRSLPSQNCPRKQALVPMQNTPAGFFTLVEKGLVFPLGAAVLCCPSKRRSPSPIHKVCRAPVATRQREGPAAPRAFVVALSGPATR